MRLTRKGMNREDTASGLLSGRERLQAMANEPPLPNARKSNVRGEPDPDSLVAKMCAQMVAQGDPQRNAPALTIEDRLELLETEVARLSALVGARKAAA